MEDIVLNDINASGIRLRFVEENDAAFIISLRTDPLLGKYLSKTDNNLENQVEWIKSYKKKEKCNKEFYYIIEDINKVPWGTYRLYNLNKNSFTIGSWLALKNAPDNIAIKADILMKDIGFFKLGYNTCEFDVRKNNKKVLRYHKLFKPTLMEETELDYLFTLEKNVYVKNRETVMKILGVHL